MITSIRALEFEKQSIKSDSYLEIGVSRHDLGILSVYPESLVLEKEVNQVILHSGQKDISENKNIPLPQPGEVHYWTMPDSRTIVILQRVTR